MNLTWEEIKEIANHLDEVIGNHFHDAIHNVCVNRLRENNDYEISDEDILLIKEELKLKL